MPKQCTAVLAHESQFIKEIIVASILHNLCGYFAHNFISCVSPMSDSLMPDSDMTTLHFASRPTRQMQSRWEVGRRTKCAFELLKCAVRESADSPTSLHLTRR